MHKLSILKMVGERVFCSVGLLCLLCLFSESTQAAGLSTKERVFLGDWFCKSGANKDFYTFYANGNYQKETELYGREVLEKGAFEVRTNTLYLARLVYVADGEESRTNIVFVREIVTLTDKKIVLTHQGGLGNIVETVCSRKQSWFWW